MARLTLLLPAAARWRGATLPAAMAQVLGRAHRAPDAPAGTKPQLLRHLDVIPRHCPEAPITRQRDAGDAIHHAWLRADPAHVRADINAGRMLACGDLGLTPDDCEAFIAPLKSLFGDEGFPISAPVAQRWYLMIPRESKLPPFSPPEDALGDNLEPHLPQGDAGRRWRRLLNEAQVILHNHPRNAQRIARGQLPVNSLWFWGGGVLPDVVRSDNSAVLGDDALLAGLADLAKIPLRPLPARWSPTLREGNLLVDLRDARDLASLASDWIEPAAHALRGEDQMLLDFADGLGYSVTRGQRWRFWRIAQVRLPEPRPGA